MTATGTSPSTASSREDLARLAATAPPECVWHPAVALAAGQRLPIAAVAEATGVSAHALRYYERIGLVRVPRDAGGRRTYGPLEVGRVVFIDFLRSSDMPIRDLRAYFTLVAAGPGNEDERVAILRRHRDELVAAQARLVAALSVVDFKLAHYAAEPTDQEDPR